MANLPPTKTEFEADYDREIITSLPPRAATCLVAALLPLETKSPVRSHAPLAADQSGR